MWCVCVSGTLSVSFSVFVCSVLLPSSLNMTLSHTHTHTHARAHVAVSECTADLSCPWALNCHHRITSESWSASERVKGRVSKQEVKGKQRNKHAEESVSLPWTETVSYFLKHTPAALSVCGANMRRIIWQQITTGLPATLIYLNHRETEGEDQMNLWTEFLSVIVICAAGVVMTCVGYR